MRKASTKKVEADEIPVLKRGQLGRKVPSMDFKQYVEASNVVVLTREIHKAFPTSEAVNEALGGLLAVARRSAGNARRSHGRGAARR